MYIQLCQQAYMYHTCRWYLLIKNFMVILDIHTCRPIRITKKKIKLIFNSLFRQEGNIIFPHIAKCCVFYFDCDVYKRPIWNNLLWIAAHVLSWSFGKPELLTRCYGSGKVIPGLLGPLNPARNSTYSLLQELYREILNLFQDQLVHIGGDEVPFECWYFILWFSLL